MKDHSRTNEELLELRARHVPPAPFNVAPIFVKRAYGALLEDVEGRQYIDFAGGIGVENVGHCAPRVVAAIRDQAELYIHTCFHVAMYEPYVELAKRLNGLTPGDFPKKTFFVNSGAEAVENAVKIARYYTGRPAMVSFENAFHGRTYMAMTLTSKVMPYKKGFGPYCPEVYRMPFAYCYRCAFGLRYPECDLRCADALDDFFVNHVDPQSVAAVIAEPVQGEGGFVVPPKDYFIRVQEICRSRDILFIMDEIQTGIGRTGRLFASEHFGVEPDIIVAAKSLAAGLPLASVTGRAEVMDKVHVGGLGGTYGGNPLACRAALAVLDAVDGAFLERASRLGQTVLSRFLEFKEKYPLVGDVRGLGPMVAMELVRDRSTKAPAGDETKEIIKRCWQRGLILISCGQYSNVIRTLMPLVITDEQLQRGLSILEEALAGLSP